MTAPTTERRLNSEEASGHIRALQSLPDRRDPERERQQKHYGAMLEEAEGLKDTARLNWLEQRGGLIGIDHVGYGDYRHYAGPGFKPLRELIDAEILKGAKL